MTAKVIFNPYSSRWKSLRRRDEAENALKAARIDYEIELTNAPVHASEIASEAVKKGFDPIIAAGGDGTIGEVVNGMILSARDVSKISVGILPLGTGNDLAANLGLPLDLNSAAEVIAVGNTRRIDLGKVNDYIFINNAGIGLESYIGAIQQKITKVHGILRYLLATFIGIYHNIQWSITLEWNEGQYSGPVTLVSIGNGARTGDVFYTVPNADPFDGKLSFAYGFIPTRILILGVLPKTMRSGEGNYVEHPAVNEVHCTWLRARVEPATPAHADGGIFASAINTLEYSILPAHLPILVGN
ncbi:MAG: YegS/Rv2252/BmrU family lipid kinase [Chloroflexi bacterium]|nr:YegS/Rv2252/BmrU family lipid kinase [Chloroflexota bacterium]